MIPPQLLTEKHRREDRSSPFGVGLEVSDPLPVRCGKSEQPQNQRGQRRDEQQGFEALGVLRSRVTQREPESVALEVADGLLDLHALGVDALDAGAGPAMMRQRGGEQPRRSVHLSILRATSSALARPARARAPGAHQIQPAPVPVLARQTSPPDMAHPRGGLWVQRMDVAPAPCFRSQVFDAVANPPDPVPSECFDVAKPWTAESRVGDDDRPTALGQARLQLVQEPPVSPGIVVAAHRMHFFVDRNRSPLHRYRRLEDELLVREPAVGPIDEDHWTCDPSEHRPRQGAIDALSFLMQVPIAQQSVHGP